MVGDHDVNFLITALHLIKMVESLLATLNSNHPRIPRAEHLSQNKSIRGVIINGEHVHVGKVGCHLIRVSLCSLETKLNMKCATTTLKTLNPNLTVHDLG